MRDLTELNQLEQYLKIHDIPYERIDREDKYADEKQKNYLVEFERHQICVPSEKGERLWDAICHRGSYGAEQGLLEIMGTIVSPNACDTVEGWLTAKDVIERIEEKLNREER